MATIQNRSRITVTVKNRPDVTRSFPYNALNKVEAYVKELRSQRFRPEAKQGDDTWEVRFREKGQRSCARPVRRRSPRHAPACMRVHLDKALALRRALEALRGERAPYPLR